MTFGFVSTLACKNKSLLLRPPGGQRGHAGHTHDLPRPSHGCDSIQRADPLRKYRRSLVAIGADMTSTIDRVHVWAERLSIPTYGLGQADKNPMFLEKRVYQGSSGV